MKDYNSREYIKEFWEYLTEHERLQKEFLSKNNFSFNKLSKRSLNLIDAIKKRNIKDVSTLKLIDNIIYELTDRIKSQKEFGYTTGKVKKTSLKEPESDFYQELFNSIDSLLNKVISIRIEIIEIDFNQFNYELKLNDLIEQSLNEVEELMSLNSINLIYCKTIFLTYFTNKLYSIIEKYLKRFSSYRKRNSKKDATIFLVKEKEKFEKGLGKLLKDTMNHSENSILTIFHLVFTIHLTNSLQNNSPKTINDEIEKTIKKTFEDYHNEKAIFIERNQIIELTSILTNFFNNVDHGFRKVKIDTYNGNIIRIGGILKALHERFKNEQSLRSDTEYLKLLKCIDCFADRSESDIYETIRKKSLKLSQLS